MTVCAIVGANWGDEGKGRLVDALAGEFSHVVRFQGGANAGHTVINERGRFVLHQLPSGVFHPHVTNVLGPGVALDLAGLERELDELQARGVTPRLLVSDRAGLLMSHHRACDAFEEQRLAADAFGSTRSGIAPHYGERYEKRGCQVADVFDAQRLSARLEQSTALLNLRFRHAYGQREWVASELVAEQRKHAAWLEPLTGDVSRVLHDAWRAGGSILFEGQLGALRDPLLGIYPYVTSSSPLAAHALQSVGLAPQTMTRVIAVTKAYASCVGAGPFVTELTDDAAHALRERGGDRGEYGATTGRPRRVGWFDAVATRYGCRIQGASELALTCLDVLGYLEQIPVCTAYIDASGERSEQFPATAQLIAARPHYELLPGWGCALSDCRTFAQLPAAARRYIDRVETLTQVPVRWVSVGPAREALIER